MLSVDQEGAMAASHHGLEDLVVYQKARALRRELYLLVRTFPPHEKFNLSPQIRRAATSVTNNIAEGHGRYHFQESIQFFRHARGSLEELIDDLNICLDENYAPETKIKELRERAEEVERLINGYIRFLQRSKEAHETSHRS